MVNETEERKLTAYQSALSGGAAGAITRAVCQPLDVIKIRFQLQLEPIKYAKDSKYKSVIQAITSVAKEEGVSTLWSGHVPAQFLSITYGIVQFSLFETLTQACRKTDLRFYTLNKLWVNFANGGIAATFATIVSYPFDTLRTRLIAEEKSNRAYRGFTHAFSTMLKTEGALSFYKGMWPTLGQIAPYAGIQFTVYKFLTDNVLNKIVYFQRQDIVNRSVETTLTANLLAGSAAGYAAKTLIYPFDLTKKRLQIQGFQKHRSGFGRQMYCSGLLHCIKLTILEEGVLALFKGYLPSTFKAVFVSALHFAVYEEIKHILLRMD